MVSRMHSKVDGTQWVGNGLHRTIIDKTKIFEMSLLVYDHGMSCRAGACTATDTIRNDESWISTQMRPWNDVRDDMLPELTMDVYVACDWEKHARTWDESLHNIDIKHALDSLTTEVTSPRGLRVFRAFREATAARCRLWASWNSTKGWRAASSNTESEVLPPLYQQWLRYI